MPSVLDVTVGGSTVGANYQKITVGSQLGTPELQFVEVAGVHSGGAVNFTKKTLAGAGAYTDGGSIMAKAVNALQGFAEVYIVGVPSATEFVVAVNENTANRDVGNNGIDWTSAEAAILAACGIDTSVTLTELTLTGDDLA